MRSPLGAEGLRRDLSLRLMLPMLAIVAFAGLLGVTTAQRLVDQVFDRWLLDSANALANQVRQTGGIAAVDLTPSAAAILAFDEIDRTSFNVTQSGRLLAGEAGLPDTGEHAVVYANGRAFDSRVADRDVRIAAVEACRECAGPVIVRVAETVKKRQRARLDILEMLLPLLALLAIAGVTIVLALRRTILPLERIAASWNERSTASLRPIGTEGVPRELLPFAMALNRLLTRIRAMLARERQFATTAAHQLRTPLAGLQLGLSRAAEAPDLSTAHAVIAELQAATQRTARLIQQLLSLGRLDPEVRGELAFVETDLVTLARDVGAAYLDLAIGRSIALEIHEPEGPIFATVHLELAGEALGNLVDNAIRYTPPGGKVVIEFDADPPAVRVVDSGPGLDPEVRANLFERFVRGPHASGEGSGLGLSIVRDIAVLHGADIVHGSGALGGLEMTLRFGARAEGGD